MDNQIFEKVYGFFKQNKHQLFKKGEILIRADDEPSGVFYLTKGKVKEYAISKKGEELIVNIFKPEAFFPMSWAVNQTPNVYYYQALEDVETWKASREKVIKFIKDNPDVLFDLLSRVFKGVDGVLMRLAHLMSGEAYDRVITELLIASKRFGSIEKDRSVRLIISEKELASQAGMARETVSREIKILKDEKLVTFNKNVLTIPNIDNLESKLLV